MPSPIALYYHAAPSQLAIACFVTEVGLKPVHYAGLFVPPISFLLPVSRVFSVVAGYGLMLIILSVICYFAGGWPRVFAMLGARVAAALVGAVLEIFYMKRMKKSLGFPFTGSERSFFHAYRLLAGKHDVSTDLSVSDEESAPGAWMPTYMKLAMDWPVVVSRFSDE